MKFVLLESRGGNYMVVVENIAWLRTDADGQSQDGDNRKARRPRQLPQTIAHIPPGIPQPAPPALIPASLLDLLNPTKGSHRSEVCFLGWHSLSDIALG